MLYQRFKICSVVMAVMLSGLLSAATRAQSTTPDSYAALEQRITETIANVRTGTTPETRADAAEHLADLTPEIASTKVDAKNLADMVALLDTPEDPVRLWVAVSLGDIGGSARTAIPKLQELLPEADCLQGDLTVADAIRYALLRMQAALPPPTCGRAEAKEVLFKKLLTKAAAMAGQGEILDFRSNAARHLSELARWIGPDKVDDQAVTELVSLLNTSTDIPVRSFVIGAFSTILRGQYLLKSRNGRFGTSSKEPSMAISVEDDARLALRRMGVAQPPSPCGRPYMD